MIIGPRVYYNPAGQGAARQGTSGGSCGGRDRNVLAGYSIEGATVKYAPAWPSGLRLHIGNKQAYYLCVTGRRPEDSSRVSARIKKA